MEDSAGWDCIVRLHAYKSVLLLLLCLVAAKANGQDEGLYPMDSIFLPKVDILATRPLATRQQLEGAELQALSSTTVADALKYFAGVQIKDYGGLGGLKTINVRSLGAQHVGVYIDGIRITNAQNGTVDLGKFSLSTMESVELYNANKLDECQSASEYASGSTVYFRTRRPKQDSISLQLCQGSFGTWMAKTNTQFARRGWSGFVDMEGLSTKGDYPFRYKSEFEDTIGRRSNSDIKYLRAEGALFHHGFSSHIYYYNSQRGTPGGIVRRLSDKYVNVGREWDQDIFLQASQLWQWGDHTLKFNAKYSYEYLRYCTNYPENQNTARVDNHYYQNDIYGAICYGWMPFSFLSLNASCDIRYSTLDADLRRFSLVRRLDEKQVLALKYNSRGLQAAVSLLHQHYKDYTFAHVGAADPLDRWTSAYSLGYTLYGLTLRAWYKQIFRAPTLNDLYYTQVGNRNLKPEYTKQWNIGLEYNYSANSWRATLQADGYINKIENRIVCLPLKGTYTWSMLNYGYTYCRGLNATGKLAYNLRDWNLSLLTSLTWQRDLNRTDPNDIDLYNKPICYSPTLSYSITGIAAWRSLSITISDLYVSERMWSYADPEDILKPYSNIDMKVSYHHPLRGRVGVAVSVEVNDLLDEQYEHIPRYPMPGRNYRVTVSLEI